MSVSLLEIQALLFDAKILKLAQDTDDVSLRRVIIAQELAEKSAKLARELLEQYQNKRK